jgi:heptose I phosphotransferase
MSVTVTDKLHEKQGRSIARWTLTDASGGTLVVFLKRHFVLPTADALKAKLYPQRAWSPGLSEWEHLAWAAAEGFPVPRAVAAAEFRGPGLKLQSMLAVEELAGMLPLHEAVPLASQSLNDATFALWKRSLFTELARLSRELHRRRVFHKDLYFCHFYIREADITHPPADLQNRVVMIDLHRLAHHRLGWQWFVVKDMGQLLYSSNVPGVTDADRNQLWDDYRRGDWHGVAPPEGLRRFAFAKARRYQRHHDKHAPAP